MRARVLLLLLFLVGCGPSHGRDYYRPGEEEFNSLGSHERKLQQEQEELCD